MAAAYDHMEDLLIIIFQFVFEVVLQVLAELPWDLFIGSSESRSDQSSNKLKWVFVSLALGGAVGAGSLVVRPDTFLKSATGRIAYLILAAPISAWCALVLARAFVERGRTWINPRLHAICAFSFALVLTIVRFTYAHRPT